MRNSFSPILTYPTSNAPEVGIRWHPNHFVLSQDLYFARRYPEAVEQARKDLELDPKYFWRICKLALIYLAEGKSRDAIAAARSAREDEPLADRPTAVLGMAYAADGQRAEAQKVLAEMNQKKPAEAGFRPTRLPRSMAVYEISRGRSTPWENPMRSGLGS